LRLPRREKKQPEDFVAFETLQPGAGAEYYVDNAVVSSVPEPSSLAIAGLIGPVAIVLARRRRWRRF